ncbi:hypothetical protein BpHYR1_051487 [Brachionus plicatilis]|uniref:Uncharacterized protein n=1 Tax=Brachionus plicatilis TaxID=10195 RepID=A0A3M7QJ95_BRAPC|nr:hypothetical protein BpHYR1_051487 [Brachionus plicatilis]
MEREFRTRVEWLPVHKVHNPQVQTTYAFLRFVNSDIHSIVVQRFNGISHRGRELNVKINPLPTPAHRINSEHTPRVQTIINELQSKEDEWELERLKLMYEKRNLEKQLEQTTKYATQLESQNQQHHANPVEGEIKNMETLIKMKEDTIKRWKSRGLNRMVQHSEANLEKLKEKLAAKLEQAMTVTDLKAEFLEASEICRVLSDDKERLESELDELRVKNEQLSQRYSEKVEQLKEENEAWVPRTRGAVEVSGLSRGLHNLNHQRLTELDRSSLCPMCRGVEVTNCLRLF